MTDRRRNGLCGAWLLVSGVQTRELRSVRSRAKDWMYSSSIQAGLPQEVGAGKKPWANVMKASEKQIFELKIYKKYINSNIIILIFKCFVKLCCNIFECKLAHEKKKKKLMNLTIITTCTKRKKLPANPYLSASNLLCTSQSELQNEWCSRIQNAPKVYTADSVYSGRGFNEINKISKQFNLRFYIISAGYGLINKNHKISSYDLTISGSSSNNICRKVPFFSYNSWWQSINSEFFSLTKLIISDHNNKFVIALSSSYWNLIKNDLSNLPLADRKRVRIIGLSNKYLPEWACDISLPYDERFDGPDSPLPGIRSNFPQRATVHYIKEIFSNSSPEKDKQAVQDLMCHLRYPPKITRKRVDDDILLRMIMTKLRQKHLSSALMLKWIRNEALISCEQNRCARLYKIAIKDL
jgi:hypothetical protein